MFDNRRVCLLFSSCRTSGLRCYITAVADSTSALLLCLRAHASRDTKVSSDLCFSSIRAKHVNRLECQTCLKLTGSTCCPLAHSAVKTSRQRLQISPFKHSWLAGGVTTRLKVVQLVSRPMSQETVIQGRNVNVTHVMKTGRRPCCHPGVGPCLRMPTSSGGVSWA